MTDLFFHKRLLSLFYSGVYLSASEISKCAQKAGIEVYPKKRDHLMHDIASKSDRKQYIEFLKNIDDKLTQRLKEYKELESRYQNSGYFTRNWSQKIIGIKNMIKNEIEL